MKKLISAKFAGSVLLIALGALFIFHILVLLKVLPADIVWGGQIRNAQANPILLESIALLATLLFMLIIAARAGYVRAGNLSWAVNIGVWMTFAFLVLNALGNLASPVPFEKLVAAPITIILALCALRLAIEK
jgi:hypothetical protein